MYATAELQVIPIGTNVSVRPAIQRVIQLLGTFNLIIATHASGTNLEGELDEILRAVAQVHEMLHAEGTVRLVSFLKLETRTDKRPTLAGKQLTG